MTTEVSTRPRGCRRSGTRRDVLADHRIYVGPESVGGNRGSARERRERGAGGDELSRPDWCQLSHWHAVAGDQKRLAAIQAAHDLPTGVAELAPGDRTRHSASVARVLRSATSTVSTSDWTHRHAVGSVRATSARRSSPGGDVSTRAATCRCAAARSRYLMSKRPRDVSGVWRTTSGRYSSRNTRATSSCREATPSFS